MLNPQWTDHDSELCNRIAVSSFLLIGTWFHTHSATPTLDAHLWTRLFCARMKYSQTYKDCCKIQRRIMEVLDAVANKDLANVAKGYVTLETLKLRLRMKGPPKPVDAEKVKVKVTAASFRE